MAWWNRLFRRASPASLDGLDYRVAFTLHSLDGEREAVVHEVRDGWAYVLERERVDGQFEPRHDGRMVGPFDSARAAERFIVSTAWFTSGD